MNPTDQQSPRSTPAYRGQTGPKTPEGKARSSRNAVKHGLRARSLVLPGEDARECESFVVEIIESLSPNGKASKEIARQIAETLWLSRRLSDWQNVLARMADRTGENRHGARLKDIETEIVSRRGQISRLQKDPAMEAPLIVRLVHSQVDGKVREDEVYELYYELIETFGLDDDPNHIKRRCATVPIPAAFRENPLEWREWTVKLCRVLAETLAAESHRNLDAWLAEKAEEWNGGLADKRVEARRQRAEIREEIAALELERRDLQTDRVIPDESRQELLMRYDAATSKKLEKLMRLFEVAQRLYSAGRVK